MCEILSFPHAVKATQETDLSDSIAQIIKDVLLNPPKSNIADELDSITMQIAFVAESINNDNAKNVLNSIVAQHQSLADKVRWAHG